MGTTSTTTSERGTSGRDTAAAGAAGVGRSGIQWANFRRLTRFLRGSGGLFAGSLVLLFAISGLTAAKAWIVQPVVDAFSGGGASPGKLYLLCGVVAGIFLVQAGLNYGYAVLAKTAGAGMIRSIREALFRHLLGQTLGYFAVRQSADLTARVVHDIALFETAAVNAVQRFIRDLFTVALLFTVMFSRSWVLALVCVGIAFAMGLVLTRMNHQIRTRTVAAQERLSAVAFQLTELIAGMEVVLSFGLGGRWLQRFATTNDQHYETGVALERTRAGTVFMVQSLVGLGVAAILLVTGRALLLGEITPGQFGSFLAALYLLQTPLSALGDEITEIVRGLSAGERALAILDDVPVMSEPSDPAPVPDGPFSLEFRDVSFTYADQPVLHGVSFRVDEGELVAIVGDSGAGKSTLARLMLRFYDPTGGSVRLWDTPLSSFARRDLHRVISYVSQDVFLFDGSIRHNLTISDAGVSAERIEQVIDEACLRELIESLPEGLETHVGERGVLLSGGERQRIAVARALLSEPRLLVLDEATSALDTDLERRLLRGLLDRGSGRTVVAISHRLRLAEIADRVLAMKDGRLAEAGTPGELAGRGGEYARLLAASAGDGGHAGRNSTG